MVKCKPIKYIVWRSNSTSKCGCHMVRAINNNNNNDVVDRRKDLIL